MPSRNPSFPRRSFLTDMTSSEIAQAAKNLSPEDPIETLRVMQATQVLKLPTEVLNVEAIMGAVAEQAARRLDALVATQLQEPLVAPPDLRGTELLSWLNSQKVLALNQNTEPPVVGLSQQQVRSVADVPLFGLASGQGELLGVKIITLPERAGATVQIPAWFPMPPPMQVREMQLQQSDWTPNVGSRRAATPPREERPFEPTTRRQAVRFVDDEEAA